MKKYKDITDYTSEDLIEIKERISELNQALQEGEIFLDPEHFFSAVSMLIALEKLLLQFEPKTTVTELSDYFLEHVTTEDITLSNGITKQEACQEFMNRKKVNAN